MKAILFIFALIVSVFCTAGTGHAKDMDITYLLILTLLGIILLIWNSIDYLSDNKEKIKSWIVSKIDKMKKAGRNLYKHDYQL